MMTPEDQGPCKRCGHAAGIHVEAVDDSVSPERDVHCCVAPVPGGKICDCVDYEPSDPKCGFDDCEHSLSKHPRKVTNRERWPCAVDGCNCVDFAQPGSVFHPPGAVLIAHQDAESN